jgi:hypothetical protein
MPSAGATATSTCARSYRNTADIMLVVDSDQRIRYASPALRELIGIDEISPLATLYDLVHPDDRTEVRHALQSEGDGTVYCALQRADQSQVLVEATYRDLREDRLVQGFVVTMRKVGGGHMPDDACPPWSTWTSCPRGSTGAAPSTSSATDAPSPPSPFAAILELWCLCA